MIHRNFRGFQIGLMCKISCPLFPSTFRLTTDHLISQRNSNQPNIQLLVGFFANLMMPVTCQITRTILISLRQKENGKKTVHLHFGHFHVTA